MQEKVHNLPGPGRSLSMLHKDAAMFFEQPLWHSYKPRLAMMESPLAGLCFQYYCCWVRPFYSVASDHGI